MLATPLKTRLEHTQVMFSECLLVIMLRSISANSEVDSSAEHIYVVIQGRKLNH
jgi:hypothetical protein